MRAKKFYQLLAVKKDTSTLVLCLDLMQNQSLPKVPIGEMYNSWQLWLYILGIVEHIKATGDPNNPGEHRKDNVHFYTWGEEQMARGSNQVGRALKDFIEKQASNDSNIHRPKWKFCNPWPSPQTFHRAKNWNRTQIPCTWALIYARRSGLWLCWEKVAADRGLLAPWAVLFARVWHVHMYGRDWEAFQLNEAMDNAIRRPAPFKISEAKVLKISPAPAPLKFCAHYSAPGTDHTILKFGNGQLREDRKKKKRMLRHCFILCTYASIAKMWATYASPTCHRILHANTQLK